MKVPAAKAGAFSAPAHLPAMQVIRSQATGEKLDTSIARMERMIHSLYENEQLVADLEKLPKIEGRRMFPVNGRPRLINPGQALKEAQRARDEHIEDFKQVLDYAATVDAYESVPCGCGSYSLPNDSAHALVEAIDQLPATPEPAIDCARCGGTGQLTSLKADKESKDKLRRIKYWTKELDTIIDTALVRSNGSGASDAQVRLEKRCRKLFVKFGNEKQTSLEGEDAVAGVRQGVFDAARRFDPTRKSLARFETVAYNWCFRNSRARHEGQKRPGVYAPSVDGMGEPDQNINSMLMQTSGPMAVISHEGKMRRDSSRSNSCHFCNDTSEIDPETWEPTGMCKACTDAGLEIKETKKRIEGDFVPKRASDDLRMDLRKSLALLPNEQRMVIAGELGGLTTTQISRQMGVSTDVVMTIRDKAFSKLRLAMSEYAEVLRD